MNKKPYEKPALYRTIKIRFSDYPKLIDCSKISGLSIVNLLGKMIDRELARQIKHSALAVKPEDK